jgi:hypothetical protein
MAAGGTEVASAIASSRGRVAYDYLSGAKPTGPGSHSRPDVAAADNEHALFWAEIGRSNRVAPYGKWLYERPLGGWCQRGVNVLVGR